MPAELIGAEILKFGSAGSREDSLLGIEYKTKEGCIKRIIFHFDETGMWIMKNPQYPA